MIGREISYDAELARPVIRRWMLNTLTVQALLMVICAALVAAAVVRTELMEHRVFADRTSGEPYPVVGFDDVSDAQAAAAVVTQQAASAASMTAAAASRPGAPDGLEAR